MVGKIGVLALQGAFRKHCEMLDRMGVESMLVRTADELAQVDGLIIPGGESTTILSLNALPLNTFQGPIFGTCAGMIVLTKLGLLDISIERNAYGPQINSFSTDLIVDLDPPTTFHALFIRAPRVTAIQSPSVRVLAHMAHTPVLLQQGHFLACSFHPELTKDPSIHHYFIQICKAKQSHQPPLTTTPTKSFQMT